jgi:phosphoglycolate phosphatase
MNIIFDWSGVLSDDLVPVYEATMAVFDHFKTTRISLDEYKKEFVLPYMNFYKKYIVEPNKREGDKLFMEIFSNGPGPTAFPDALKFLETLHRKGIKMIILSSHVKEALLNEAEKYGFKQFFTDINASIHDKTEAIMGVVERNGFSKDNTFYIGDMKHDIDAGKKAGVKTISVCWGYKDYETLAKENPSYIVHNFQELQELLLNQI